MAAGNHFLDPSGKQRDHYVNKRCSVLHVNLRYSCTKNGLMCVAFNLFPLISLVALFAKKLAERITERIAPFVLGVIVTSPGFLARLSFVYSTDICRLFTAVNYFMICVFY